jgi:ABC-type uncharacterized transport system substrate-binding protein
MQAKWWLIILVLIYGGSVSAADQELRIAMVLWRGKTEAETGFKEGLQELGYQTTFEIHDAAQDLAKLGAILHSINGKLPAYDYI